MKNIHITIDNPCRIFKYHRFQTAIDFLQKHLVKTKAVDKKKTERI